jgi:hypothetical protein
MADWLKRQYSDIRGNFKWGLLMLLWWLLTTYGKMALTLIPDIPAWVVNVVLFLLALIGFIWIAKLIAKSQHPAPPDANDLVHSVLGGRAVVETPPWFSQIVKTDQRTMEQKLLAVTWQPKRALEGSDPYIEFGILLVNLSVFDLDKPEIIRGKVKFRNQPLAAAPQIEKSFPISHGTKGWLIVRQFLTTGMATDMKHALSADQATVLDFSDVRIPMKGHCDVENCAFDWVGSGNISFKEPTPIVG